MKFPWNAAKMVKNLQCLKTLQIFYLRHAEHHAKNRTCLRGLDQDTLFFEWPVTWQTHLHPRKKTYSYHRNWMKFENVEWKRYQKMRIKVKTKMQKEIGYARSKLKSRAFEGDFDRLTEEKWFRIKEKIGQSPLWDKTRSFSDIQSFIFPRA